MATAEPEQLRFSPESLDFRDEVRNRLWERMTQLAVDRARAEHRQRVTEDDVKATLEQAIREVLADIGAASC